MSKKFSVFVEIGGKLNNSLPDAAAKAEGILARIGRRMTGINAGTAGAFTRAAQNLDAAGKRIGEAGRNATARISAPAGLLGWGAGKMAFEFEKAGNALEALGDATSKQRKDFEAFAGELNKEFPQTLTGILKTGNEMLKGGFNFDQMRGALKQTLMTAVLGEMEPAEVGNMMARTINSFQLPMKTYEDAMRSSQRVSDQMTFAAVRTTASLKDMGEMYRYVGGASSAAGISLEQASAFAMAFAKNGSVGSDAGVAMRSAIVRLVKMPPKALGALESAGMKLGDYVGGGRKVTADNVLSGLQADGIDASPVKKQIAAALNNKALADSPVKLAAEITKLVQTAMTNAGSALDASTIAQSVQDSITVAGSKIDLVKFFGDLKARFDSGAIGLGHVATILEGRHVSRFMAILQSDLPALIRQIETESAGYAESRYAIMLKGIVGPVYELSAALEKLSVALGRASFPTLAKGLSAVADQVGRFSEMPGLMKFTAAIGLGAVALGPFLIAGGATVRVVGLLVRGLGLLGTVATLGLATRLVAVASGIRAIAVASTLAAVGRLRALAAGIIALGAVGGSRAVLAALAGSFAMLGRAILALPLVMLKGALVGIAALFSPVGVAVAAVTTALAALGLWVYNNLGGIGTFFTSFGDAFMKALGPEASQNVTAVVGWLKQAWQWVNNLLGPIDETGKKWASWGTAAGAAAGAIVAALIGLPEKIGALAKQGYDALVNFDWAAAGRALVEKIASGITGAAGALGNALKGAVSGAWESAKGAIGLGTSPAAPKAPGAPTATAPGAPVIAGARALGGPVTGGLPYLVGERGPEIFVPSTSGRIETNGVLNSIAKAGGRAAGGNGLTIGVDATAVEEAGKTAKAAGAQLHAALDATRKPIVDTSSIDAATAAAERLKAVLATVGAGTIRVGGEASEGGAGTAVGAVGRSVGGSTADAVGARAVGQAVSRSTAGAVGSRVASPSAGIGSAAGAVGRVGSAEPGGGESVTVNGHRYRAGAGSEEGKQRVASWLGFLRRPLDQGGLGLEADKSRAMVAMLQGESHANLNPGALGDYRGRTPTAFGTAQWRLDRADALRAVAAKMGRPWSDVEAQQAHFRNEMLGRYRHVFEAVKSAPSGEHALAIGIDKYENPAKKALAYRFRKPYLDTLRRQEARAEAAKPAVATPRPGADLPKPAVAAAAPKPAIATPRPASTEAPKTAIASVRAAPVASEAGKGSEPVPGTILDKGREVGKLAGARAMGGPVSRGLSYLVGERGPEIFTPGEGGAISTNGALARLTDLGSRMTPAEDGGRSPSIAPSPKAVAELRPQGGTISTRGDTHYAPVFHIQNANDPQAVRREIEMKFFDFVRQQESDQRGLLSD